MAVKNKLDGIVKLSDEEFERLKTNGTLTEGDVSIDYSPLTTFYWYPSLMVSRKDLEQYAYDRQHIDEIDNELTDLSGEVTTLQGEVTAHDLTITSIEELNKDQETKINALEKARADLEVELGEIQDTITDLEFNMPEVVKASKEDMGILRAWIEDDYICFSTIPFENHVTDENLVINGAVDVVQEGRVLRIN